MLRSLLPSSGSPHQWGAIASATRVVRVKSPEQRADLSIALRRIVSVEEYRACESLQDLIWGSDRSVRLTTLVMITAQNNGGMVIGAFTGDESLIGFVCSYPGITERGELKQCSQLMAVHPAYRNCGVGLQLKLAQREATLAQGVELLTWTYDPLASGNAYLNIAKLGCVGSQYLIDCYGTTDQGLNAGMPTDRLLVEWWIRSPWVEEALARGGAPIVPAPRINDVGLTGDFPRNGKIDLDCREPRCLFEIPSDIAAIKRADMPLAQAWREQSREVFETYFKEGYRVIQFGPLPDADRERFAYVLQRKHEAF